MTTDPRHAWIAEVEAEVRKDDPVAQTITLHRFVSTSKGRRNGRKRPRRCWKEVYLVKYLRGGVSPVGPVPLRCLRHRDIRAVGAAG
jgi:hypothetical protein